MRLTLVNIIGAALHAMIVTFVTPLTLEAQQVVGLLTFGKARKPLAIQLKLLTVSIFSRFSGIWGPEKPFLDFFSHTYLPWHFPSEVLEITTRSLDPGHRLIFDQEGMKDAALLSVV